MIKKLYYKISIMVKIKREKNKLVKKAKKKDCTIKSFNDLIHKIDEEYLINKAEEENINEKLRLDPPIPEYMNYTGFLDKFGNKIYDNDILRIRCIRDYYGEPIGSIDARVHMKFDGKYYVLNQPLKNINLNCEIMYVYRLN